MVLTMVYTTQNYCFGGLISPSSGILEIRKCSGSETGSVSIFRQEGDDLIGYELVENKFILVSFVV
jgi:hypothetical protein